MNIKQSFDRFHQENPAFYQQFCRFALQLLAKGHKRLSSKLIVERIRWETMLQSTDTDYKINNNFTPHFARKFMADFPNHDGVFETRAVRA